MAGETGYVQMSPEMRAAYAAMGAPVPAPEHGLSGQITIPIQMLRGPQEDGSSGVVDVEGPLRQALLQLAGGDEAKAKEIEPALRKFLIESLNIVGDMERLPPEEREKLGATGYHIQGELVVR